MNQPTHLTNSPVNAELLAWHTEADIAAYKLEDGSEVLFVNGKKSHIESSNMVQVVISICYMGKRDLKKFLKEHA